MTLKKYLDNRIEKALGRPTVIGDYIHLFEGELVIDDGMQTRVSENCIYMFIDDEWKHIDFHNRCPHCGKILS